jgi:hypothetical protein
MQKCKQSVIIIVKVFTFKLGFEAEIIWLNFFSIALYFFLVFCL